MTLNAYQYFQSIEKGPSPVQPFCRSSRTCSTPHCDPPLLLPGSSTPSLAVLPAFVLYWMHNVRHHIGAGPFPGFF